MIVEKGWKYHANEELVSPVYMWNYVKLLSRMIDRNIGWYIIDRDDSSDYLTVVLQVNNYD